VPKSKGSGKAPVKPGTPTPASGQYVQTGPKGGHPSKAEVTGVKDKPMPPTSKPGDRWQVVDPTKHKGKK
jgi:hypothetical protein